MSELKPCPMCGDTELDGGQPFPATRDANSPYVIRCGNPDCGIEVSCPSRAETVAFWNARPTAGAQRMIKYFYSDDVLHCNLRGRIFPVKDAAKDLNYWVSERENRDLFLDRISDYLGVERGDVDGLLAEIEGLKTRNDELQKALKLADDWIQTAPHGDNCYVTDEYPGNECYCNKEFVLSVLEPLVPEQDDKALAAGGE